MNPRLPAVTLLFSLIFSCFVLPNSGLAQTSDAQPNVEAWKQYMKDADYAWRRGRDSDRINACREARKISASFGPRDPRHVNTLKALARAMREAGGVSHHRRELIGVYEELLMISEQLGQPLSVDTYLIYLSELEIFGINKLKSADEKAEQIRKCDRILMRRLEVNLGDDRRTEWSHLALAEHYARTNRLVEAEYHARKALALAEKLEANAEKSDSREGKRPYTPSGLRNTLTTLARVLETKGDKEGAMATVRRRQAVKYAYRIESAAFDEERGHFSLARNYREQAWKIWSDADDSTQDVIRDYCLEQLGTFEPPAPPQARPSEEELAPEHNPNQNRSRETYSLHGRVVDNLGKPLSGADVVLKHGSGVAKIVTGKNGLFEFEEPLLYNVQYTYSVTKEGYQRSSGRFSRHTGPRIVWMYPNKSLKR